MNDCLQILFSGLVAISTVVYAILTCRLVTETKKMRLLQITPDIFMYLEKAEADPGWVYMKIENNGYGIAKDVIFEIIKDFNCYDIDQQKIENKGIIKNGLSNFYPKQKFKFIFTDLSNNTDNKINDQSIVKVKFKDINDKKYEKIFNLAINELAGIGIINPPDTYLGLIFYELKQIKNLLIENKNKK